MVIDINANRAITTTLVLTKNDIKIVSQFRSDPSISSHANFRKAKCYRATKLIVIEVCFLKWVITMNTEHM